LAPAANVIALLVNPENRNAEIIVKDVRAAALTLGKKVQTFNISSDRDLETFFATPMQQRPGARTSAGAAGMSAMCPKRSSGATSGGNTFDRSKLLPDCRFSTAC
jgi:hypothetical protein